VFHYWFNLISFSDVIKGLGALTSLPAIIVFFKEVFCVKLQAVETVETAKIHIFYKTFLIALKIKKSRNSAGF
jgi:hypothetical protein